MKRKEKKENERMYKKKTGLSNEQVQSGLDPR